MGFNGKSLILVGAILFIFQIANFISIETITPELERAQVLAAIASLIIILIGFLFKQFEPLAGEKADLKGENKFLFDRNMPDEVIDELAWGSEAILTSTAAASILIHNDGVNIKPVIIKDRRYLLMFSFIFKGFGQLYIKNYIFRYF